MKPRFLADHDLNETIVTGVLRAEPSVEFRRVREFGIADRTDDCHRSVQNQPLVVE